jgi:maltodextrin utilization protein YvdJ
MAACASGFVVQEVSEVQFTNEFGSVVVISWPFAKW